MKTYKSVCWLLIFLGVTAYSQENSIDSLFNDIILDEIIISTSEKTLDNNQSKALSTLVELLEKSPKINMIKRGSYAWEPLINGMATERTLITIDGMRIFGACTDKMDPITSYVEISHLSKAEVSSGQQGSFHGATIAGALDFKKSTSRDRPKGWNGKLISGYESNNKQKVFGGTIGYNHDLLYANVDFMYRDAENYKAGKDQEIPFSQFSKFNISG